MDIYPLEVKGSGKGTKMKSIRTIFLILIFLAGFTASCTGNVSNQGGVTTSQTGSLQTGIAPTVQPTQNTPAHLPDATVTIHLFGFHPNEITVPVGTTVTWNNQDDIDHTVTQGVPGSPAGVFDAAPFGIGKSFSFTFTKPGDYPYYCRKHESMLGMVKVVPAP